MREEGFARRTHDSGAVPTALSLAEGGGASRPDPGGGRAAGRPAVRPCQSVPRTTDLPPRARCVTRAITDNAEPAAARPQGGDALG